MLYAQDRWSLLLIFQAMDAAGKDGAIKHVMSGVNPQGCQVVSFKPPSPRSWTTTICGAATALPERGRIGIFNRSYYEEVLVRTRSSRAAAEAEAAAETHRQAPLARALSGHSRLRALSDAQWDDRTQVLSQRFASRAEDVVSSIGIDHPEKNWKFSRGRRGRERGHWDDYMDAYEDTIRNTSTEDRRGTSCRLTTSGSRGSWWRLS